MALTWFLAIMAAASAGDKPYSERAWADAASFPAMAPAAAALLVLFLLFLPR